MRVLLEEANLGKTLAVKFESDNNEIGFSIGNFSAMAIYAFQGLEWENFVKAVNKANLAKSLEDFAN